MKGVNKPLPKEKILILNLKCQELNGMENQR